MLYLVYNLVFQSSRGGRERAGCFTLTIVFLLTFGYKCSVPLPNSAMSLSALSACGIFPGYTHLHFGHSLLITIKINQLFCIKCLTVCHCSQTVNCLENHNYSRSLVEYEGHSKITVS